MTAHRDWLEAWKGSYQSLCLFVVIFDVKNQLYFEDDCY